VTAAEYLLAAIPGARSTYGGVFLPCPNHPTPTDALVMWADDSRAYVFLSCDCGADPLRLAHQLKVARLLHPLEKQHPEERIAA